MRIGIVAPEFPPDIGGVETYSYEFSRELARRGHEVIVFTIPHPQGEIDIAGIKIIPTLAIDRAKDNQIFRNYSMDVWHVMNAAYAWMALEFKPVVISVHGLDFVKPYFFTAKFDLSHFTFLWHAQSAINKLDKRFDFRLSRFLTKRLIKESLPRARRIITNSHYTERILSEKYPACKGRISVGYVGVSEDFFKIEHVFSEEGQPLNFVTICTFREPRKNVDKVLRALAGLKNRYNFTYNIIGKGVLRLKMETLCKKLGLENKVNFLGALSKEELKQKLASGDLFILTSSALSNSFEGFGIAYLEANACGTPVLAARLGGAAEAVKEGLSGMFVENPTVDEIKIALEGFLSGQVKFEPRACKEFASQFTWAKVVDKALECFKQVSGDRYANIQKNKNFIHLIPWRICNRIESWMEKCVRVKHPTLYKILKFGRKNINTPVYWDKVYQTGTYAGKHEELFNMVLDNIPNGAKILDVGCGTGELARLIRDKRNAIVTCLDFSRFACEQLIKDGFKTVVSALPKIPLPDNTFDTVMAIEVLEHLDDPQKTIIQMARVVRPGGIVICTVPNNRLYPSKELEHQQVFTKERFFQMLSRIFVYNKAGSIEILSDSENKFLLSRIIVAK